MPRLLRQKTSGFVYVWTANLATRDDMEEYDPAPKAAVEPENTSENSPSTSADEPDTSIEDAKAAFRRQVRKGFPKPKKVPGDP